MDVRLTWEQICRVEAYQGRWVALQDCRYHDDTGEACEGAVVDTDEDLAELCTRVRDSRFKDCAILYCAGRMAFRPD